MSDFQAPRREKLPLHAVPPLCFACIRLMRFVALEPHIRFPALDVRSFACECGETAGDVVVRLK
jgi:hypothetical protein